MNSRNQSLLDDNCYLHQPYPPSKTIHYPFHVTGTLLGTPDTRANKTQPGLPGTWSPVRNTAGAQAVQNSMETTLMEEKHYGPWGGGAGICKEQERLPRESNTEMKTERQAVGT